jgi:tripeptidyl-peptidase-1
MWIRTLVLVALYFSLYETAIIPVTHTVHEKRDFTPTRWIKRDRIHSHVTLPVRIGLTQSNLDRGYEFLMDM